MDYLFETKSGPASVCVSGGAVRVRIGTKSFVPIRKLNQRRKPIH